MKHFNMEEGYYTSLETAKLAKDKGFDWETTCFYTKNKTPYLTRGVEYVSDRDVVTNWNDGMGCYPTKAEEVLCSAPEQVLLLKWLREVHNIHVSAFPVYSNKWYHTISHISIEEPIKQVKGPPYNPADAVLTYEEAMEKGLYGALELFNDLD